MSTADSTASSELPQRPTRPIGRRIFAGLIVAFVILVVAGALSLYSTRRFALTSRWVEHTSEVLYRLSTATGLLNDEETGLRGYALTGRADFLQPYESARGRIAQELERIRVMTADNAAQQARLAALEVLVADRHNFADRLLEARRKGGLRAAADMVAATRAAGFMVEMRGVLSDMAREERALLARRTAADRREARRTLILTGMLAIDALLLVIAAAIVARRAVTRPIARLVEAVGRVGAGDLGVRVPTETDDELGQLARAFNAMVSKRHAAEEALARANGFLNGVVKTTPLAIVGLDAAGHVDVWNPVAERLFGYRPDEVLGRPLPTIPDEEQSLFEALRERVLGRGESVLDVETTRRRKDGTLFDARVSVGPRLLDGEARGALAIVADMTEQKRHLEALRESEERFRLTFDEAAIGMGLVGIDGRLFRVNAALCDILGYEEAELTTMMVESITHPEDAAKDAALATKLARGEIPRYQLEKRYVRKDGRIVHAILGVGVVRGRDGAPLYYVGQVEDITVRIRAEETLRRSEETLNRAQRVAHLGSWERDLRSGITVGSPEIYAIFGVEGQAAQRGPNALLRLVPPEELERLNATVAAAARDGRPFELEHTLRRPSGEERVVRVRGECDLEDSVPVRMTGTILDVTEIRHAERELRDSLLWLRQVLAQSPVGMILAHGETGEHVEVNERARRMIGHSVEASGGLVAFLDPVTEQPIAREDMPSSRALRGERFTWSEYGLRSPEGRVVPVVAGATPVLDDEGRLLGAIVIFQDITPIKDLERLRAEWNSIIAHDLRQPLNTISLNAELLARRSGDGAARAAAEHITTATRRLDRMINDLLDLSRLDAKQLTLAVQAVDLPALVRDSVAQLGQSGPSRPIEVRGLEGIPPVLADPDRIAQVLDNLLSNAAKYGLPGTSIIVELGVQPAEVSVSVTNTGPGIEPDELPRLFRRFHRTDEARRSGVKGIGLGLYITRELVEAHGGRISAESAPGGATTFRFTLPRAA